MKFIKTILLTELLSLCVLQYAIAQGLAFTTNILTVGNEPFCVVAADVNGDGKLDLISANFSANTLTVLTNNGSGIFGSNATINVGNGSRSVVAADVNGDGKLDLICANSVDGTLTVLTNNGSGILALMLRCMWAVARNASWLRISIVMANWI